MLENENQGTETSNEGNPGTTEVKQDPTPTPAPATTTAAAPVKKVISLPTDALGKLKAEERERGRREAARAQVTAQDAKAKEMGFGSHAEMLAFVEAKKKEAEAAKAAPPARSSSRPGAQRLARDHAKWESERAQLNRALNMEAKKAKQMRRQLDATRAEMTLREQAARAGVQDVEYALHLLKRAYAGKTAEALAGFDESKFFGGLREQHPHLFSIEKREATTGTGEVVAAAKAAEANVAPAPAKPPAKPELATPKDMRTVPKQEYRARLRELGLRDPSTGSSV